MKKLALFLLSISCFAMGMNSGLAKLKALVFQQKVFTISYLELEDSFFVLQNKAFKHAHELNLGLDSSTMHYFEAKMRELQGNGSQYLQSIKQAIQNRIISLGDLNTQRPIMENHIRLIDIVLNGPDIKKIDDYLAIKALVREGKVSQAMSLLDVYKRTYGETDSWAELVAYTSSMDSTESDQSLSMHQDRDIKIGDGVSQNQSQSVSVYQNRDMRIGELPQNQLWQKFSYIMHSGGDCGSSAQPSYQVNHGVGAVPDITSNTGNTSSAYYPAGLSTRNKESKKQTESYTLISEAQLFEKVQNAIANFLQNGDIDGLQAYYNELKSADGGSTFAKRSIELIEKYLNTRKSVANNSIASTADLVSTPARPVPNISKEIDVKIQETLNELKDEYPDFQQYMQAVSSVLQDMQNQGLLVPTSEAVLTREVCEAISHGAKHFVRQFQIANPLENPRDFVEAVVKYGIYATFHIMTDGAFLGADKLALIGTQVHALFQTDFSGMSASQKAEFVAEGVAEAIKMALVDQIGRRIIPKSKLGGMPSSSSISSTHEVREAVTPEGVKIGMSKVDNEASLLKNGANQVINSVHIIQDYIKENRVPLDRETILMDSSFTKTRIQRVKGAAVYERNNMYYHRDTFHTGKGAHLEVYNKQGAHLGEANPITGELIQGTMDKLKNIKKLL